MTNLGEDIDAEDIDVLVSQVDKDKDGFLNYQEFVNLMTWMYQHFFSDHKKLFENLIYFCISYTQFNSWIKHPFVFQWHNEESEYFYLNVFNEQKKLGSIFYQSFKAQNLSATS